MRYISAVLVVVLLIGGPWLVIEAMDALTYPWGQPPIAWPDEPPPPIIDQVPATAGLPPPQPATTHKLPIAEPAGSGGPCSNGQCASPTSEPSQRSEGTYRRGLFLRRFR
jgi:hypothetical protein